MKNLKKVLSLVLALAMALSLMTVAFAKDASDFNDYDDVTYTEAVDVMVAVGVFNGADGNNFAPTATLTREQAAKIITYMLLGQTDADKLTATVAPYADVAAGRWSAGAITYCTNEGILAGVGGDKFAPTAQLTGLEFAKMLLCALGYDAQVEGLTGSAWAINTAKLALGDADLDDGMEEISRSGYLTREQAAQMAFNAAKARLVGYGSKTDINVNGAQVVIGNNTAYYVTNGATSKIAGAYEDGNNYTEFAEKHMPKLVLDNSDPDTMGRPAHEWVYDKESVGVYTDAADYTVYVTSSIGDNAAAVVDDINKKFKDATADVYVNGQTSSLGTALAVGDKVEIYMDSDDAKLVDTIAITHLSVAQLTGDAATKVSGDDTLVKVPGIINGFNTAITSETVNGYEGLKEDAIVLYYTDNEGNYYLQKAETFNGILTAYTAGTVDKMTVSGKKYEASGATGAFTGITVTDFYKENATWYVDTAGNPLWVVGEEATDIAYVIATKSETGTWAGSPNATTNTALLLLPDNTVVEVKYENATGTTAHQDMFVKYSVKDDVYTLTQVSTWSSGNAGSVTTGYAQAFATTKGNPNITINGTNVLTNADTLFFVRDYDSTKGQVKNTYTMYTGYTNVPTIASATPSAANGKSAVAYIGANDYAKYVVIDTVSNVSGVTTATDLFYVVNNTVTTLYDADGITGYTVKAIKNGGEEIIDLEFAASPSVNADTAYIATAYNTDGQITAISAAITDGYNSEYLVGNATGKATATTFALGGTAYGHNADTVVYYIDKDEELTVTTVADLEEDADDTYVAVRASKTSTDATYNTIKTLFVKQVPTDATAPTIGTDLSRTATATAGTATSFTVAATADATATVSYSFVVKNGATTIATATNTTGVFTYTFATAGSYTVDCTVTATDTTVDGTQTATKNATQCTVTVSAAP